MNWEAWLQPPVLTSLLIGVYGALLSTVTLVQTISKNRRGWKILTGTTLALDIPVPFESRFLSITFVNEGHRPITVHQMTLQLPNTNWMANVDDRMPNA